MKRFFLLPLVFALILSACKYDELKDTPLSPISAQLKAGESQFAISPSVSVSLDSVLNDSRCPENVQCIWAGNAEVQFLFADEQGEVRFTLNTNPQFITERIIRGYRIQLVKLTPYPNTNIVIKQSDYKAELSIRKE